MLYPRAKARLTKGTNAMSTQWALPGNVDFIKLFEPDALASAQYYTTTQRTYHLDPELRLMAAILEDAVASLTTDQRRCSKRQRREHLETLRWINATNDKDWVFSFANVCENLGIDSDYLREGLLRKVAAIGATRAIASKAKGRLFSPRHKLLRLRTG